MARGEAIARYKGKPITTIHEIYDIADGKVVHLEGIECKVQIAPAPHAYGTRIWCNPTPRGRKHPNYVKQKREYRDDWDFDLSQGDRFILEVLPQIPGFKVL